MSKGPCNIKEKFDNLGTTSLSNALSNPVMITRKSAKK